MGKDLEFFFPEVAEAQETEVEILVSERFKDSEGNIIPWKISLLSADEIYDIKKRSTKSIKKGGQRTVTVDTEAIRDTAIVESVIYPNLKDVELQEAYGAMTPLELAKRMLEGREYERLGDRILKEQGFIDDINTMIDDAKN